MKTRELEWDPEKSRANLAKRGISFLEAQRLWQGREQERDLSLGVPPTSEKGCK
ncbi:MAG: BrnT family toxin [Atopobiaceae bacterium]|nr:BrnT family toxin [Atopobiaceae bacterium]